MIYLKTGYLKKYTYVLYLFIQNKIEIKLFYKSLHELQHDNNVPEMTKQAVEEGSKNLIKGCDGHDKW